MKLKKLTNNLIKIIATSFTLANSFINPSIASEIDDTCLTPDANQYFELRAVEVKEVENQNKQLIMELWGNNIEFKRI